MTDLVTAVLASADSRAEQPALTSGRTTLGYAELARRIRSTASGLRAEGLQPGDRVLFSVRPGPQAVILALGIVLAGGVVVFADPGAGEALFRSRARLAAPRWVAAESLLYLASSAPLRRFARRRGLELRAVCPARTAGPPSSGGRLVARYTSPRRARVTTGRAPA